MKRLMALYGSQHYAGGGRIKSAIQWTKGLLDLATPTERKGLEDVYNATKGTKKEAISLGESLAPQEHFFGHGNETSAPIPPDYIPFMQGAQGTPVYSAHTHPTMAATPSQPDLGFWANHWTSPGELGHKDVAWKDPSVVAQDMWIRAMNSPNDVTLIPGFTRNEDTPENLMRIIRQAEKANNWASRDVRPQLTPLLREFSQAHGINSKVLLPREEDTLYRNLHYMTDTDRLAQQTPVFMDAETRLAGPGYPGSARDLKAQDVLPELLNFYDSKGFRPYADGGEVEGYEGGGKFGALRSYAQAIHDLIKKPITVGVDTKVVPKIVDDGRFKSQFETGTSNGSYEPDYRAKFERDAFGLPLDLPVEKRPIYGHMADRDTLESARHYGDWGAVLDPKVNERSTFFLGDSLGSHDPYGPYPFKPPSEDEKAREMLKSFAFDRYDGQGDKAAFMPRNLKGLLDSRTLPGSYVEAQVHGGLPWSDVRALIGKRVYRDEDDAASALYNIANIADRPSLAAWGPFHSLSKEPMRWMRANPGQGLNRIDEVPASALAEFGYADGGEVRHLITGYDGQFYADGGAVDSTIEALNKLRGMKP